MRRTALMASLMALLMASGGFSVSAVAQPQPPQGAPEPPQNAPQPPQGAPEPPQGAPEPPQGAQPPPGAPEPPQAEQGAAGSEPSAHVVERTPPRLSFMDGEVSFWRTGAEDWTPASLNTPLAPGDSLYTGTAANLELQIGPRAFVRAGQLTQLTLDNQEPDFLQFRITAGHASLDLRGLPTGHTVELDTPNAAFTIERTGYYRVDVVSDTTTFITRRGGSATMIPAGGQATAVTPSEQVVVQGTDSPQVESYVAPEVDSWDHWNYSRTDHLIDAVSQRYVPPAVYGTDSLDHYGTWRVMSDYGPVWVPQVAPGWAPYTTGRWIWDPYYGWTWVDTAPWGWAPYHYGRWVYASGFWGWAPGPLVVAPAYAPALVAFFGGHNWGVSIGLGAPAVGWVALGWGEPVIPWWGPVGFVGHCWWGGWGGPHVVNNVVVNRTTIVNVNTINNYQNVHVHNAVVATRENNFGRGTGERVRVGNLGPHQLEPVRGRLPVSPAPTSLTPGSGHARRPPESVMARPVVATRAPHDTAAMLRSQGLNTAPGHAPQPHLVERPRAPHSGLASPRAPFGQQGTVERPRPPLPPRYQGQQPREVPAERGTGLGTVHSAPSEVNAPRPQAPAPHAPQPHIPPSERASHPAPQPASEPRVVQPPAPRAPAPSAQAPSAPPPPVARRAPSGNPPRAPRGLPGEPANRLYRGNPGRHAPHAESSDAPGGPRQPHQGGATQRVPGGH